mmetsp:Transcript_43027/g.132980  ORF Transcript_43027/g.132980 Transcript_43027/m.132980 type:complete len:258 (+) Transcript_43027:1082-1855(+)
MYSCSAALFVHRICTVGGAAPSRDLDAKSDSRWRMSASAFRKRSTGTRIVVSNGSSASLMENPCSPSLIIRTAAAPSACATCAFSLNVQPPRCTMRAIGARAASGRPWASVRFASHTLRSIASSTWARRSWSIRGNVPSRRGHRFHEAVSTWNVRLRAAIAAMCSATKPSPSDTGENSSGRLKGTASRSSSESNSGRSRSDTPPKSSPLGLFGLQKSFMEEPKSAPHTGRPGLGGFAAAAYDIEGRPNVTVAGLSAM